MTQKQLSIVIPCFNEGDKLINNLLKIDDYLKNKQINYEIIVVNDGSNDNTKQILLQFKEKKQFEYIYIINYEINKGKGYAIKTGIKESNGEWILFMDADLSTDLSAIDTVLNNVSYYDVIIGSRRHPKTFLKKKQGPLRVLISKVCNIITNLILPLNLKDTQCGFKAFKYDIAKEIISKQTINGFAFDTEYLYITKLNNKSILEIPVIWENDDDSKVSVIKSSLLFFKDLIKIRSNTKYYIKKDL